MGCHTWFYTKIERTQEEAKESCLSNLKTNRNYFWKDYKKEKKINDLETINILNRQIRMVSNNLCQRALWDRQNNDDLTFYVDGKGLYIGVDDYHDSFRVYTYPKDLLFSLQETLDYINNEKNKCEIRDYTFTQIEEFWSNYPNGMICFG
jgi:hypothetical protein